MKGRAGVSAYLIVAGLMFGASLALVGCQKQTPPASPKAATATTAGQSGAPVADQTTCPVMGGAIDKAIFTEYKGKKVYFCCKGCIDTFNADPAKYLAKLPQFAQ